jgi:glucose-6-phosphate isomerase
MPVIPYCDRVASGCPAFLQQLQMESNGKSVRHRRFGTAALAAPITVTWGAAGTDAQHSFFQALHQGTDVVTRSNSCSPCPTQPTRSAAMKRCWPMRSRRRRR